MATDLRTTPLHDLQAAVGAKMTEFGQWELPLYYTGIVDEHHAVRTKAGLFDVSHMGEISVSGKQAADLLQELVTNDVAALAVNQALYTPMCSDDGGILDDLIIYRLGEEDYLMIVNAAGRERDLARTLEVAAAYPEARIRDISDETALLAIQGPLAADILQDSVDFNLGALKYFWSRPDAEVAGQKALVSRTGYTGEDGFELCFSAAAAPEVWERLLYSGRSRGLVPAGLGARDTLRFEACLPLYGNELDETTSPLEAGLTQFVKFYKPSFRGREAIGRVKHEGITRRLAGLEIKDRSIARHNYPILHGGEVVGMVTSGSYSPTLGKSLAMGYVPPDLAERGTELTVEARGRKLSAEVVLMPFYRKEVRT